MFILCSLSLFSARAQWQQEETPENFHARNHPVVFSIDGVGYVTTGYFSDFITSELYDDVWSFDPDGEGWTQLPDFPGGARGFAYGVAYEGKGYLGFGVGFDGFFNDFWSYDPSTEAWDQLATCPCTGRRHPAMVAVGGFIYVGMGDDDVIGNLNDWWAYDIANDVWTQRADLPGPGRHHPFYFEDNGDAYVGFGHAGANIWDDFYRYNAEDDSWTVLQFFPGEGRVAGTQFTHAGTGYILSGQGDDHYNLDTGEFYRYESSDDTWVEMPPHPGSGRWAPGTFVINNRVYLVAGRNNDEDGFEVDQKDMWSFELAPPASTSDVDAEESSIEVYPNPVVDRLYLTIEGDVDRVEVYNTTGQLVHGYQPTSSYINTEGLVSGCYLLKVLDNKGWHYAKFEKM